MPTKATQLTGNKLCSGENFFTRTCLASISFCLFMSCSSPDQNRREEGLASFSLKSFTDHISALASDEFQGRMPFTRGERLTLQYLENQFTALGLQPGNGDSYFQEVPMVEITPTVDTVMTVNAPGKPFTLRGFEDYVLSSQRTDARIDWKNVPLVFAGFGIVAPEYHWNDYENLDVKGKVVVVLVNDPGFGGDDPSFFKGNTMTYYGRWTYKFEEAARQGAKGCLVIHETAPAGYPFQVLQTGWNAPHFYLDERGKETGYRPEAVGWITKPAIEKVFSAAGLNFREMEAKARRPGFKAQDLKVDISVSMSLNVRYDKSFNVVATLPGSQRPDEYIIYSAHWDHLGIGPPDATGDTIYNGAIDNASGVAGLLEIAKAFKSMEHKPERSIVFLAVTAEEQGLLGSQYYSENPIYPKEQTVAEINMDVINPYGKMKDVMVIGSGQSELEDYLAEEAKLLDREIRPDADPEKGYYFRSDHFNFAKIGIPALYVETGSDFIGKGREYGQRLKDEYTEKHYHQPSDEYDPARMNFEGGIDDLKLLFQVGKRLAFTDAWPEWKEGSEFKAIREKTR